MVKPKYFLGRHCAILFSVSACHSFSFDNAINCLKNLRAKYIFGSGFPTLNASPFVKAAIPNADDSPEPPEFRD